MKKLLLVLLTLFLLTGCKDRDRHGFVVEIKSAHDFDKTVEILNNEIKKQNGLVLFSTLDHTKIAADINQTLKPNTVIAFDNPFFSTKLIDCNPSIGMDLPLRLLVSKDYQGHVYVQYTNPEYWTLKHNIKDRTCLKILDQAKILLNDLGNAVKE